MKESEKAIVFKLTKPDQWLTWSTTMEWYLKGKQQEEYLSDTSKRGDHTSYAIMAQILRCLGPTYSPLVVNCETPKDMWEILKEHNEGEQIIAIDKINDRLDTIKIHRAHGLEDHLTKFKHLVASHQSLHGNLSKHDLATKLLRSLPDTTEYLQLRRDVKREALHKNKGRLKLREIYAEIQTTARINRQWSPKDQSKTNPTEI